MRRLTTREADRNAKSGRCRRYPLLVDGGEIRHVDSGLPAAQARKQRDHQHLEEVVPRRVAGPGILHPLEKLMESAHCLPLCSARRGCCRRIRKAPLRNGRSSTIALLRHRQVIDN